MQSSVKLIIRNNKLKKDGNHDVFIQYCYTSKKRVLLCTHISVPAEYWDKQVRTIRPSLPADHGRAESLQAILEQKRSKAEKIIRYALSHNTCPIRCLKRNFNLSEIWDLNQMEDENNSLCVFNQIECYLRDKRGMVSPSTITVIKTMKKHLFSFQEYIGRKVVFDSLNAVFYEQFVKYLTFDIPLMRRNTILKGLKINTVGKTVKQLKTFIKDRIQKKVIPYIDLTAFKGLEEDVDGVFLNWNELSKIYHLDMSSKPGLIKYRDIFIVGCLTGFRFGDYSTLASHHFKDGMLHVKQQKTGTTVVVPLRNDAKKILVEKYELKLPKVSMVNFNYYIKEVVRLAGLNEPVRISHRRGNKIREEIRPKYAWISSHTARRSFCTNEYLAGTPSDLIMSISGHKSEKSFRKYIKADQIKKASMIKEIWDNQPGL
jgi:hypothetical protein